MKNFLHNNINTRSLSTTQIALFIVAVLVFQLCFPFLATAAANENDTESVIEVEVVEPPQEQEVPEPEIPEEEPIVTPEDIEETETSEIEIVPNEEEGEVSATTEDPDTASIETGDAESGTTIESDVNTVEIDTTQATSTSEVVEGPTATTTNAELVPEETASTAATGTLNIIGEYNTIPEATSTDSETETSTSSPTHTETATSTAPIVTITGTSTATTTNNATGTASTGNNSASATEYFDIKTGNAVSYVDLVNVVNTNIVDSDGLIEFIRGSLGYQNFDLRNTFEDIFNNFNTAESTTSCTTCGSLEQLIDLTNQAIVENNIAVTANTGNNTATGEVGEINTGNAYASANIANVVNTNVVDSNYLLLVFNNFDDLAGSLVLPNNNFFSSILGNSEGNTGQFNFSNTAAIENNITTVANTGGNQATGTNNTIETGNSVATSYTNNTVNQNLINTDSFSMLIRVHGDWSGNVFGLPEGMEWENTSEGIRLFYGSNGGSTTSNKSSVNITNDASINNNVQVYALTGDNQIEADEGKITTGQAYADTTAFNIANTNVLGSNWINLIFNIYGNWSGDIAFGQPDLWLGISTDTNINRLRSGDEVSYTYTVFNNGDTTANNVILENRFPNQAFSVVDNNTPTDGYSSWPLGSIASGETREFKVHTKISSDFGNHGKLPLPLTARVWNDQPDANDLDNEDSLLLYVGRNKSNKNKDSQHKIFDAKFVMEKSADKDYALAGDTVNYTVKFTNRGGPIFDSILIDILKDSDGNILSEQTWPLDKIPNGETINITYSIVLPQDIKDGVYTNTAQLLGMHSSNRKIDRTPYESPTAKHELNVGTGLGQLISGIIEAETVTCAPYLTTYMKQGKINSETEVTKLQRFLQFNTSSKVSVTGIFDKATKQAVQAFQQEYADDILTPWGMTQSSGYVYYTTQKKINEIMCDNTIKFPLTTNQEKEISIFLNTPKANYSNSNFGINTQVPMPPLSNDEVTTIDSPTSDDTHVSHTEIDTTVSLLDDQMDDWIQLLRDPVTAFAR